MTQSLLEIVSPTLDSEVVGCAGPNDSASDASSPTESSRQISGTSARSNHPVRGSVYGVSGLARVWSGLKPGDLVAGKYRVERVQSQAGLLCAVQVQHLVLDTRATLKYLTPESSAFPETISSFLRGARLLSQLHTQHVASVLDVGMLEFGTPYLVMDQPEGPDFAQVLRVRGALPIEEARMYAKQMCEGLAQAHALGIIHGALRPSNIILTKRQDGLPIACITDFGSIDRFDFGEMTRTDPGLRTPREVLEVVRYLSPDHARFPDDLDARCDVWAIGTILHELLAGEPAFFEKTAAGLLAAIAADAPSPLRKLRPEISEALEGVVRCCFAKQRDARLANGSQLLRALEASDDEVAELSRPTRSSFGPTAVSQPSAAASVPVESADPSTANVPLPKTATAPAKPTARTVVGGSVAAVAAGLLFAGAAFWAVKLKDNRFDVATPALPQQPIGIRAKPAFQLEPRKERPAVANLNTMTDVSLGGELAAARDPVPAQPTVVPVKVIVKKPNSTNRSTPKTTPTSEVVAAAPTLPTRATAPAKAPLTVTPTNSSEGLAGDDPFGTF